MATRLKQYRLTKRMKDVMRLYLVQKIGAVEAAATLGIGRTQLYIMTATIVRDAGAKEIINVEEILKNY